MTRRQCERSECAPKHLVADREGGAPYLQPPLLAQVPIPPGKEAPRGALESAFPGWDTDTRARPNGEGTGDTWRG